MGCTSSKLDDLPAVALCRDRCKFLDDAIQLRFAFADAHVAYTRSLKDIGDSFSHFIGQDLSGGAGGALPSPKLNLPPRRKGDPIEEEGLNSPHAKALHSHSNSGSHLNFHSDSEDDEDDSDAHSLHHSGHSSPLHPNAHIGHRVDYDMIPNEDAMESYPDGFPPGFMHINYMKKHTPY